MVKLAYRQTSTWIKGITILVSTCLFISTWLLNTTSNIVLTTSDVIGGIVLLALSFFVLSGIPLHWQRTLLGIMLLCAMGLCAVAIIYSPTVDTAFWNTLGMGVMLALLLSLQMIDIFPGYGDAL